MKILFPLKRPRNLYLDEIENHFDGEFVYDSFYNALNYKDLDAINIQWPETIHGKDFNESDYIQFKEYFFKIKIPIFYTRHNIYPHENKNQWEIRLHDFIANNADAIIHLGNYSIMEFKQRYPDSTANHYIVEHPLYTLFPCNLTKEIARKKLKIKQNSKVILVFGKLRHKEEYDLVKDTFHSLKLKNKVLLVSNYGFRKENYLINNKYLDRYSHSAYIFYKNLFPQYNLNDRFIENEDVQLYLKAADVLFIPRYNNLNSGNVFLGFTFGIPMVAPDVGNISEFIHENEGNFLYNPNEPNTAVKAIEKVLNNPTHSKPDVEMFHPKAIAEKYKSCILKEINRKHV